MQPCREDAQLGECERQPAVQQRADDDPLVVTLQRIGGLRGAQQRIVNKRTREIEQRGQNNDGEHGQHK